MIEDSQPAHPTYARARWCAECCWGLAQTLWLKSNGGVPGPSFADLADDERQAWFDHAREVAGGAS